MMSDNVIIAFISMLGSVITVAISMYTQVLVKRQDAKILKTQETIVDLEKNTNSIKDALVEVTRKAAFARGLKSKNAGNRAPVDMVATANAAAAVAAAAATAAAQVATAAAEAAAALKATVGPVVHAATIEALSTANTEDTPINVKLVD